MATANIKAEISASDNASSVIRGVGNSFGKMTAAMAAGQLVANAVSKAFNILKDSIKSSVNAAFDQVRQVENATFALRAYEKNGGKVNKVLKSLVAYARSDLGTLFKREDLFDAAQTLKLYGQSTDSLVGKVKILSKGVSLGKTSFQELSSIVGRAAAKGRLDAVDFDMLIERGIGLDKSFRGAKVTSEQLFKALDKALPAELLKGRANTIDGLMIKLQTSFRDVGSQILGVNSETSQFIKGGLGDQFLGWVKSLTNYLKSEEFKAGLQSLVDWLSKNLPPAIAYVKDELIPQLVTIIETIWPAIRTVLEWLGKFIKFLSEHEEALWIFIGVLGTLKAAFLISDVVAKFKASLIVAKGAYSAFSALVSSPIAMPALVLTAAIASIWAVWKAYKSMKEAIAASESASRSNDFHTRNLDQTLQTLRNLRDHGTPAQKKRAKKALSQAGSFASGGFTGRGASNEFAGIVHKGEYVVPREKVNQSTGTPKSVSSGPVNIVVQAGAFMGSQQDARKYAEMIVRAIKDNAQMNGVSVGQMLGA